MLVKVCVDTISKTGNNQGVLAASVVLLGMLMASFLGQVWPWHFPSLLGKHLQEDDRQGAEV